MHKDVEGADRNVDSPGDLLRYALESTDEQEVPLRRTRFSGAHIESNRRALEID